MRRIHIISVRYYREGQDRRDVTLRLGLRRVPAELRAQGDTRLVIVTDTTENLPKPRSTSEGALSVRQPEGKNYHLITISGSALDGLPSQTVPLKDDEVGPAILEALSIVLPEYQFA